MSDKINIQNQPDGNDGGNEQAINKKLDELLDLLAHSDIDSEKAKQLQQRVNDAIGTAKRADEHVVELYQNLDTENKSRADLLDDFSILLNAHQIDSNVSKKYIRAQRGANVVLMVIGLVMITLGFAMIVMPAPPDFEIYTVFYFNINDGVTVMDLISLLIVLSGIYLFIRSLYSLPASRQS